MGRIDALGIRLGLMSDAGYCEKIVFQHARTFALASRLLTAEKRRGVYAVYAFCRGADDLVDLAPIGEPADAIVARLRALGASIASPEPSTHPMLRELRWAVTRFGIAPSSLQSLLAGVERDLHGTRYETWLELQHYCHAVASSVGEMCTAVFGVDDERHRPAALDHARLLGVAMQLTNILRDAGEDRRRGRCYFPDEDLARAGLSRDDVLAAPQLHQRREWRELMAFEIERARALFARALPGIPLLAFDAQRCAWACATGYAAILDAIEANAFDTITRRAVVTTGARARVFWRAWLRRAPELTSPAADTSHAA